MILPIHFRVSAPASRDTDSNLLMRFLKKLGRNIKATGPMSLLGVVLSALFQRYVPADVVASLFGDDEGFGVLMAASIGVPLYACGGGTPVRTDNPLISPAPSAAPAMTDIPDGAWFADAVNWCLEQGLMDPDGARAFAPAGDASRAALAAASHFCDAAAFSNSA